MESRPAKVPPNRTGPAPMTSGVEANSRRGARKRFLTQFLTLCQEPFPEGNVVTRSRNGTTASGRSGRLRVPCAQSGQCAEAHLRRRCRLRGAWTGLDRGRGTHADPIVGLLPHAHHWQLIVWPRKGRRALPIYRLANVDAHAASACPPPFDRVRLYLPGPIQVISGPRRRALIARVVVARHTMASPLR
jgi:hypothetical protein